MTTEMKLRYYTEERITGRDDDGTLIWGPVRVLQQYICGDWEDIPEVYENEEWMKT